MAISLEHDVLKADLAAAARALSVTLSSEQRSQVSDNGRVVRVRTLRARLPKPTVIRARFAHEGWLERAKKLVIDEPEVGSPWFDDRVYVTTSTREATQALLTAKRVQQALILLVDPTRHVEIDANEIRVIDDDAPDDGRDATAELLAIAAHVIGRVP